MVAKKYGVSSEYIRYIRKEINPNFVFKTETAYNKINFTDEQMNKILYGTKATKPLAKELGVSYGVIKRIRDKIAS